MTHPPAPKNEVARVWCRIQRVRSVSTVLYYCTYPAIALNYTAVCKSTPKLWADTYYPAQIFERRDRRAQSNTQHHYFIHRAVQPVHHLSAMARWTPPSCSLKQLYNLLIDEPQHYYCTTSTSAICRVLLKKKRLMRHSSCPVKNLHHTTSAPPRFAPGFNQNNLRACFVESFYTLDILDGYVSTRVNMTNTTRYVPGVYLVNTRRVSSARVKYYQYPQYPTGFPGYI